MQKRHHVIRDVGQSMLAAVRGELSAQKSKAKAYLEVRSAPWMPGTTGDAWAAACREIDALAQRIATDFLTQGLATVGQKPASGADRLSR